MQKQPSAELTFLAAHSQSLQHARCSAVVMLQLPWPQPFKWPSRSGPLHCSDTVLACQVYRGGGPYLSHR